MRLYTLLKNLINRTIPHTLTYTANPNITVARAYFYRVGNVIHMSGAITVDSQLATNQDLFVLPVTTVGTKDIGFYRVTDHAMFTAYMNSAGRLRNSGTWATGSYNFNGSMVISGGVTPDFLPLPRLEVAV